MADRIAFKDTQTEARRYTQRLIVAMVIILLLLGLVVLRYFTLQVLHYDQYHTQSERNRVHVQPVAPPRGLIFDRKGRVLADSEASYTLTVTRERVSNMDATLAELKSLLALTDDEIDKFRERQHQQRAFEAVPLRFQLTEEEIAIVAVNRYRLEGVEVEAQLVRHYPMGELFAPVIGYVGRISDADLQRVDPENYAGTQHIGKNGLESYYEDVLHGQVGYENVETNARGRVLRLLDGTPPVPGQNLYLSVDAYVQKVAFDALQGERGAVVAIDPQTGEIIAFVSTPSYDPNLFIRGISKDDYLALRDSVDRPLFNRALQAQYPPGSTMKPFYGLAGLDYGVNTPESAVNDPGVYTLPNDTRQYHDWKKGGHGGPVNLLRAIAESCDVYFYDLANRLGIDRLSAFAAHFGFGQPTGVDLTGEARGLLPSREWKQKVYRRPWYPGETLSLGIGQGYMLATPLQLADATAMLANRGLRLKPHLVARIGDRPVIPERVDGVSLKQTTYWDAVKDGMIAVTHGEHGTARGIGKDASYLIAGKTGTAQVVNITRNARGDAMQVTKRQRDHALFISYAPADNPRLAVAVIVENGEHGASAAAPIARKVFDAWLLGEPKTPPAAATPVPEGTADAADAEPAFGETLPADPMPAGMDPDATGAAAATPEETR